MKKNKFFIPVSMAAALVGLVTCAVSCAKKDANADKNPLPPPPEPLPTNAPAPAALNPDNTVTNAVTITNIPAAVITTEITNPPPATTTAKAPEIITATDTNLPGHTAVVEMPATIPVAPTNFYAGEFTNNAVALAPITETDNPNYFLRLRVGYEYISHGDDHNVVTAGLKFYAYGDGLRESVGKNGWLIPDADVDISSEYLPKPDSDSHPGSANGLRFRTDLMWPWFHWTSEMLARTNSVCPFARPLAFNLGPTLNLGFDHIYTDSQFHFAEYAGVRLTFNRSGFIEYTVGDTDGLDGTRQQVVAEIPFYESRNGEVHYGLRGLWNHGANNRPDVWEGGLYLEMPFSTVVTPSKWGDLVPFGK